MANSPKFTDRRIRSDAEVYRYDELSETLKNKIIYIWQDLARLFPAVVLGRPEAFFVRIDRALRAKYGLAELVSNARSPEEAVYAYFSDQRDVEHCLDIIEEVFKSSVDYARADSFVHAGILPEIYQIAERISPLFQEHSIGYEFRNLKFFRIDSAFLHKEVVVPALEVLLAPNFVGASGEFNKAHEHFRHRRFGETINECLKAFESTMKAICHKRRWPYNQTDTAKALLTACEKNGLFSTYLQSSFSGLRAVMENVATIRNKLSAHGQGVQQVEIPEEIARFVIQSTAANIRLLASLEEKLP